MRSEGPVAHEDGQVGQRHFERILGGLGVQDVLFAEGSRPHEYGTSVRTYDAGEGIWRVVWMQPEGGEFAALVARADGDEILQEGRPLNGEGDRLERWRFVDLTKDTFTWLGEASDDGGRTWRLEQRMDARRMAVDAHLAAT
ncbi:MAG TPA: hypothetical protein VHN37_14010 [Actinomycetota bacterium]|nr:hypothetical protein [Actinomycetota bacterium]